MMANRDSVAGHVDRSYRCAGLIAGRGGFRAIGPHEQHGCGRGADELVGDAAEEPAADAAATVRRHDDEVVGPNRIEQRHRGAPGENLGRRGQVPVAEVLSLLGEVLLCVTLDLLLRPHVGRGRVGTGLDRRPQGVDIEHAQQVHGHTEVGGHRGRDRHRLLG